MSLPAYWCPTEDAAREEAGVERVEQSGPAVHVKFDLAAETLAALPELAQIARREGSVRTSLVIWTDLPWTLLLNRNVFIRPGSELVVLKVPGIDGTELWIVTRAHQAEFEKEIGWQKPATPLLAFGAERLIGKPVAHPLAPQRRSLVLADSGPEAIGLASVESPPNDGFPPTRGMSVGEADESVIGRLEESGSLVSRSESRRRSPYCGRCRLPVYERTAGRLAADPDSCPRGMGAIR